MIKLRRIFALLPIAMTFGSCTTATVDNLPHLAVRRFLADPVPYDDKSVCVRGELQYNGELDDDFTRNASYPNAPVLRVHEHDALLSDRLGHVADIEVCGLIALDKQCFGIGLPPGRDAVCIPSVVTLTLP